MKILDFFKKKSTLVSIAVAFVLMGVLTYYLPDDDTVVDGPGMENNVPDSLRTTKGMKNDPYVAEADKNGGLKVISQENDTDPYEELNELIGLGEVKKEVMSLVNLVKVQKQRKESGLKVPKMSYHLVFTGSPGTGKTTVARIVARIYHDLGILKTSNTVEVDRSGLVAEYVGQTATKTNAVIDSALNGVLFIDEAYALVPDNAGSDYGQEAISTLLKRMEDDRDRLVVIVAGYSEEMNRFIESNPGLRSRFNRYINFPDYNEQELCDIFAMYLKKNQYTLSTDAHEYMQERLRQILARRDRTFGNARYMRNVFEKAVQCQANRLATETNVTAEQLSEITRSDIVQAMAE